MRALRHIRPCLTDDVAKTIESALAGSRLDSANAVLVGVSEKNSTKLQRTQNTLAPIVKRKYEKRGNATSKISTLACNQVADRLQYCGDTLARIDTRKYERREVTKFLKYLHWLPIKRRIDYKIAVTTYKHKHRTTVVSLFPD